VKRPIPFGKYILFERINVGGMAEIFLARSRGIHGFKRLMAIKKILPTMAEDKEFINMFIDEARIASGLSHANIVQIFELSKYENDYYIAMEYVHGKDLRYIQERLTPGRKPMPLPLAILIAYRICEALDYAHSRRDSSGRPMGIIHRDISPQNVIISYEGEVKICDFGIAKAANRSQKTQAGVLKGKFGYMSPEQVRGLPLDGRSDLFTVGTLLYEMVTLQRLFLGESDFSTLEKVRNADVVPPSAYNKDIPPELEEIVLKALAREVEDRYQSAGEMADALQAQLVKLGLVSTRDLATFMKDTFTEEYLAELKVLDYYQSLSDEEILEQIGEGGQKIQPTTEKEIEEKTQIYFSQEAPAEAPTISVPPATISAVKEQLADSKTMIFSEATAGQLADARTMIFTGESLPESSPPPPVQTPRRRSLSERLFLPLLVLLGGALGWSAFTTVALVQTSSTRRPARLQVISRPAVGVAVELDGTLVSQGTPWTSEQLGPGRHRLKLSKNGFEEVVRDLNLEAGITLVLELELPSRSGGTQPVLPPGPASPQPAAGPAAPPAPAVAPESPAAAPAAQPAAPRTEPRPAALLVESTPPGALVKINGRAMGRTPLRADNLTAGQKYQVALELEGYLPAVKAAIPQEGKEETLSLTLKKRPAAAHRQPASPPQPEFNKPAGGYGYLVANTQPWARVFIDGKYSGRDTPIVPDNRLKLPAGKHEVIFETASGKRFSFNVEIQAEQTVKLIKKLED
jgi:serine/threonine protein kinase